MELYWFDKGLITQVVEEKGLQQQAIVHKLDLLENKLEAMFKVVFGIDIVVSQPQGNDINEMVALEDIPGLEVTHSNPILIDEDPLLLNEV
jgi:hypothetical protein